MHILPLPEFNFRIADCDTSTMNGVAVEFDEQTRTFHVISGGIPAAAINKLLIAGANAAMLSTGVVKLKKPRHPERYEMISGCYFGGADGFRCPHCGKIYSESRSEYFSEHLIKHHKDRVGARWAAIHQWL